MNARSHRQCCTSRRCHKYWSDSYKICSRFIVGHFLNVKLFTLHWGLHFLQCSSNNGIIFFILIRHKFLQTFIPLYLQIIIFLRKIIHFYKTLNLSLIYKTSFPFLRVVHFAHLNQGYQPKAHRKSNDSAEYATRYSENLTDLCLRTYAVLYIDERRVTVNKRRLVFRFLVVMTEAVGVR
jgi:hypothetical protein